MNTLTLTVVILVVYMAAMLLIGYMGRNKSENFKEFVTAGVNPKFCVNSIWGANRAKFIQGGSR